MPGIVPGNHRQHFSDRTGSNTITIVHRIEKKKSVDKAPTHSEARKTNFQHFRGKSSCERIKRYFFNGLQIQLRKNWPSAVMRANTKTVEIVGGSQCFR